MAPILRFHSERFRAYSSGGRMSASVSAREAVMFGILAVKTQSHRHEPAPAPDGKPARVSVHPAFVSPFPARYAHPPTDTPTSQILDPIVPPAAQPAVRPSSRRQTILA